MPAALPAITEHARAKINLTLSVKGKRPDGYHELESLVAFAAEGDVVTLEPGAVREIAVLGPFGASIAGENLLQVTLAKLSAAEPRLVLGRVTLEKRLPVAAGIGGGSADAAALLRAVQRANPELATAVDWAAIAKSLGADVPVCLSNRASWMRGVGERLEPLGVPLPDLDVILVNPLVPVVADKTARVFRTLAAPPLDPDAGAEARPQLIDRAAVVALMRRVGNDLQAPAATVVPEMETVLEALSALPGVEAVQASGGGPTCFAVMANKQAAHAGAGQLKAAHPGWWVVATSLA